VFPLLLTSVLLPALVFNFSVFSTVTTNSLCPPPLLLFLLLLVLVLLFLAVLGLEFSVSCLLGEHCTT
jgi:hypothetical protein